MKKGKLAPISDITMMVLSLISVLVVLAYFFAPLNTESKRVLYLVDNTICVFFITHFFYHFFHAENKKEYFKGHWIDLIASIPVVEQLRFARILQVLRVIRLLRMANQIVIPLLKRRTESTIAVAFVMLVLVTSVSAVLILIIEDNVPGSNIHNAEDALWWSLITISTVGYGDFYPVTTTGRMISAILIVCGVSLFGLISGLFASSLMSPKEDKIEKNEIDIAKMMKKHHEYNKKEMKELRQQVRELQERLDGQEQSPTKI